jgi:serine/threonine-protein kinase
MPPEQARGAAVDKRADVWSFGVVLYELLSGRQAFGEQTVPETLAAVLKSNPDWSALPLATPPPIRRLLRRCLERDRRRRLRDIGDAVIEIDEALAPTAEESPGSFSSFPWNGRSVLMGVVGLLAIALLLTSTRLWQVTQPVTHPLTRLSVDLGPDVLTGTSTTVVISRDGRRLVFPVRSADGKQQLATRLLDEAQPSLLAGADNSRDPFFSPDGEWVGFFADGKLKKISVHGGAPVVLCDAVNPRGASWGEDNSIVAALNFAGPLSRLPDTGGRPQPLTKLRPNEASHRWPQVLPGGEAIMFTASSHPIGHEDAVIEVLSLKTGQVTLLVHGGYFGRYVPGGHLLYVHQGVLFGLGFDAGRLKVHGTPRPLMEDVAANPITGGGQFDFSGAHPGLGRLCTCRAVRRFRNGAWTGSTVPETPNP